MIYKMLEDLIIDLLKNFGFPAMVTILLLYDKIRTNGTLKEAINNNTEAIRNIYECLQHIHKHEQ